LVTKRQGLLYSALDKPDKFSVSFVSPYFCRL
jgi:hypothetical protein